MIGKNIIRLKKFQDDIVLKKYYDEDIIDQPVSNYVNLSNSWIESWNQDNLYKVN